MPHKSSSLKKNSSMQLGSRGTGRIYLKSENRKRNDVRNLRPSSVPSSTDIDDDRFFCQTREQFKYQKLPVPRIGHGQRHIVQNVLEQESGEKKTAVNCFPTERRRREECHVYCFQHNCLQFQFDGFSTSCVFFEEHL